MDNLKLLSPELRCSLIVPSNELQVRCLVRNSGRWQVAVEVATGKKEIVSILEKLGNFIPFSILKVR